jgi:nucleotide-binding universal stress UspA family protein
MVVLKNVLVATDFGEASDAALMYGRDLARSYGARLYVLHVTDDFLARYALEAYPPFGPDVQHDIDEQAQNRLDSQISDEDRVQLRVRTAVRTSPATAAAIVDFANEANVDLIVMGTHGRGPVSHLFVGSVAERVVRTAPCPVLTVRHPERDFIVPDALVAIAAKREAHHV